MMKSFEALTNNSKKHLKSLILLIKAEQIERKPWRNTSYKLKHMKNNFIKKSKL